MVGMDILGKYGIPLKGLAIGKHTYRFGIDDDFFRMFHGPEITGGTAIADVELTKVAGNLLSLDFNISGAVTVPCDRCLEDFSFPVRYNGGFKVRFGETEDDFDGEIMWLNPAENELNTAQYIYESIVLSLPYRRIHPEGECYPQMFERFRIVSQEEFDRLAEANEMQKMEENPEWQKLREIKNKL